MENTNMKQFAVIAVAALAVFEMRAAENASLVARWSFDEAHKGTVLAPGVEGRALKFEGGIVSVPSSPSLQFGDVSFSVAAWVNPYELGAGQQMIVAKNVYSAGKREWGLMLDKDNRFRFYLSQKGWKTIASQTEPRVGHWHHLAVTVEKGRGRLYINGKQEAEGVLGSSVPVTDAPLTIGGVEDGGHVTQTFHGVLDEVALYRGVLTPTAIAAMADKQTTPHKIEVIEPVKIWSGGAVPKAADLSLLKGVEFHVIKKQRPDTDGCQWTLGVGLAWHKGRLYASYGFNKGDENTPTEEAHVRASSDGGRTWSVPVVMDSGEGNLGVSHGVFLSHNGMLWAFMGAFYDKFQRTHTRAYTLNETTGAWKPHGVVIDAGFWPMQEPQKMADGNWIMAGARVSHGYDVVGDLPAVAISHGDDFTKWDMVIIPAAPGLGRIWGESTVIVEGKHIINISRYGAKPLALVSFSEDFGRTWTPSSPSNLPMATSKPYAGILSTSQRFLVCTTTADTGGRRSPVTIAVSKPGESTFSKVFLIRTSAFDGTPGVSDARADFSYPYAVEHEGKLYVGYTHKSHAANELAVIPVSALKVDP
jgi:hypothetical protein